MKTALIGLLCGAAGAGAQTLPWMDEALRPARRAELLVAAMTLPEKIQQIAMSTGPNPDLPNCAARRDSRHVEGIPRLAVPTLRFTNGPIGVSGGDCLPDATATGLPTGLAVAATWDPSASYLWADVAGREVRANGHHVFFAPGINLARVPNAGRNFEYFGEDPFLTGVLAVQQVKAVQAHGVLVTAKHYVANEQETQRNTMNVVVDDRTLHELYLKPFEMTVRESDLASVMCSYPRVNGIFACQSVELLETILRQEFAFTGYVISDRGATNSTGPSIKAGLDLELNSTPRFFTAPLVQAALAAKEITLADIDTMLKRRYATLFRIGQFDRPIVGTAPIDFQSHGQAARQIAEQGAVLLKNEGSLLPLEARSLGKIALIGPQTFAGAAKLPATGPGGMLSVNAPYTVSPLRGLENTLAALDSKATVTLHDGVDAASAAALAAASDVAIVIVGDISLEGVDRSDLKLPLRDGVDQDGLVQAVAAANPRTIVVLKNGGPVLMPWLASVPAVLEVWYPGQEDGNAVANVLFGVVNPSGKLPLTFPAREREAAAATTEQWPGVPRDGILTSTYSEGLQMGYRWYEAQRAEPLFAFGFGLSYTSFSYSKPSISAATLDGDQPFSVRFWLHNTGSRPGAEVAQVYASFPDAYGEPTKRLVGFQKVFLNPGERKEVVITVDPAASHHPLSFWNPKTRAWELMEGKLTLHLARSSRHVEASLALAMTKRVPPRQVPASRPRP